MAWVPSLRVLTCAGEDGCLNPLGRENLHFLCCCVLGVCDEAHPPSEDEFFFLPQQILALAFRIFETLLQHMESLVVACKLLVAACGL